MHLNLKKTVAYLLTLTSGFACAGGMGACSGNGVSLPCPLEAWGFGLTGLYLRPSFTGDLATADEIDTVTTTGNTSELSRSLVPFKPSYQWGFKLEGSYNFGTGNDLNLNWLHMGKKTHTVNTTGILPVFTLFNSVIGFNGADEMAISPQWDAVNFELGQHVDFGEFQKLRVYGSVQYTRFTADVARSFTGTQFNSLPLININSVNASTHSFNGFGPRIMLDYSYQFGNGLGVYVNGGPTLLLGSRKLTAVATTTGAFGPITTLTNSLSESQTVVVPELEAQIGVNYGYETAYGTLVADLGWMWINYFDALRATHQLNSIVLTTNDSNLALQGGFIGIKWLGSVGY